MRRGLPVLLLMLFCGVAQAQTERMPSGSSPGAAAMGDTAKEMLAGVLGFRMGESRPVVEMKAAGRGYRPVPAASSGWSMYLSAGDSICGLPVEAVAFQYNRGRLAHAVAALVPAAVDSVIEEYLVLQARLTSRYGPPRHDMRAFNHPYRWGDGNELEAIRCGKAYVWTEWQEGPNQRATLLRLVIVDESTIRLDCRNVALMEGVREE